MAKSIFDSRHVELVARIRAARERLDLSQEDLARRLGKPQSFIAKIERGQRRVDVVELIDIAAALGVNIGQLIPAQASFEKPKRKWSRA